MPLDFFQVWQEFKLSSFGWMFLPEKAAGDRNAQCDALHT
jgi:hypothetical protein